MRDESELIWESYILLESFKDYRAKKIADGWKDERVDEIIEIFKKERNRLNPPENDIGYWMNKTLNELIEFLRNIPESKAQTKKAQKTASNLISGIKRDDNVDLIFADENYIAFGVKNFEGASKWASQTTDWCITKDPDHFYSYTERSVFVFLFDLSKRAYNIHNNEGDTESKIAIQFTKDGSIETIYDAADNEISFDKNEEVVELPFYDKMKEWAESALKNSFGAIIDKAEARLYEISNELKHVSIHSEINGPEDFYISAYIVWEFDDTPFKESYDTSKFKDICEDYAEWHEWEAYDQKFVIRITGESSYDPEHFDDYINDLIDSIESEASEFDERYYQIYYEIKQKLIDDDAFDEDKYHSKPEDDIVLTVMKAEPRSAIEKNNLYLKAYSPYEGLGEQLNKNNYNRSMFENYFRRGVYDYFYSTLKEELYKRNTNLVLLVKITNIIENLIVFYRRWGSYTYDYNLGIDIKTLKQIGYRMEGVQGILPKLLKIMLTNKDILIRDIEEIAEKAVKRATIDLDI